MLAGLETSSLHQTRAGTARYVRGLLGELRRRADVEVRELALPGRGRAATVVRDTAWYLAALPLAAARARVDLLHLLTYRAPLRAPMPLVVTVHDLAVLRHPEAFNRWNRGYSRLLVPRVVRAADRVIAVSEFTGRELVELAGISAERIRVVPISHDARFGANGPAAPGDYVLAVSTLEPRKNLVRLTEAAHRAGVELRVVGERGWGDVEVSRNGTRWLGRVPDDELARLYRGALCVAYPSYYEGFGIPILEAMACGAPVVTSAGGATEEVAGGAAVLVDPLDPSSIAHGLDEAIRRRAELARLGLARARSFSWRATADATVAVYQEVAG